MKLKTYMTILLCITLLFTGCSKLKEENKSESLNSQYSKDYKLNYSNLTTYKTKKEILHALENGGIKEDYLKQFEKQLDFYNETMKTMKGLQGDFITINDSQVLYDDVYATEKWKELGYLYQDYNCRITAFELFRDYIESKEEFIGDDSNIIVDLDSIENNPLTRFSREDVTTFQNLFSLIKTKDTKNERVHIKAIQKELQKRKIVFKENNKISMINVYIHDYDLKELFIGHSALLIKEGEEYLLLEKYSFLTPYQVSKFKTKREVYSYLMNRIDVDTTGNGSKPIVMENNRVLKLDKE